MAACTQPDLKIDAGCVAGGDRAAEPVACRTKTSADLFALAPVARPEVAQSDWDRREAVGLVEHLQQGDAHQPRSALRNPTIRSTSVIIAIDTRISSTDRAAICGS